MNMNTVLNRQDAMRQAHAALGEAETLMHVETRMGEYALQHSTVGCLVRSIHYLMMALEMTDAELKLALEMLREGINAGS